MNTKNRNATPDSQTDIDGYFRAYEEYSKLIRTWLVAYGVGAPVLLFTNDRLAGIQELQTVIAAGDTPYLERSHFYLAKALLGDRNISAAERELRSVVEMHGQLEKRAQVLQAQIVPRP